LAARDPARETATLIERGARRYGDGDLRGAAELWRQALAQAPDDVRARAYVAWAEACEAGQVDSLAVRVGQRYPSDDDVAAVLATALDGGLVGLAQPPAGEEESTFDLRRTPDALPPLPTVLPSLADPSDAEPTRERRVAELSGGRPGDDEPTIDRRPGEPEPADEQTDLFRITELRPQRGEELARSTHPNLAPLEVAELTDDAVEELAAAAGVKMPDLLARAGEGKGLPGWLQSPSAVVEIVAEPEVDIEVVDSDVVDVLVELEPEPATARHAGVALPPRSAAELVAEARAAFDRGDGERAFQAAERAVAAMGGVDAPELIVHGGLLKDVYERALGDTSRVVVVAGLPAQLDPRAAFLLSRVDGTLTIEDLRDVSGMPPLETARLLAVLVRMGALAVR
jgi:hypothetical protein